MKLKKLFGKRMYNFMTIIMIVGFVALFGFLYKYNGDKSVFNDGMKTKLSPSLVNGTPSDAPSAEGAETVVGANASATNDFLSVSGIETTKKPTSSCNNQPMMDPKDLLPTDKNNEWSNIAPSKELAKIPFVNAGHHIGVNTIGSSLRNPNLQVRSEPVIPQTNTGPWNNTTIEPDVSRKSLEIGASE
jgi:hypothetical protein